MRTLFINALIGPSFVCLALAACAAVPSAADGIEPTSCNAALAYETKMFFGRSVKNKPDVTEKAWTDFANTEISSRFPNGYTVLDAAGFWQDSNTGMTEQEKTKLVLILHDGKPATQKALNTIASRYKAQFEQYAVLISKVPTCSQLIGGD